jgi:hypothetical protein
MQQGRNRFDNLRRARLAPGWLLALCLVVFCSAEPGLAANPSFEIKTPYVSTADGVYTLHAQLAFMVPEAPAKAVREGATLNLNLQIKFDRVRHWWTNETVAELEQRYELVYHGVSERYLVRNVNSGAQTSFASFDEAIESLKDINGLPLLDTALLAANQEYEVNLRGTAEVRTIPRALGMLLFWVDDFSLRSSWYTWPLKP